MKTKLSEIIFYIENSRGVIDLQKAPLALQVPSTWVSYVLSICEPLLHLHEDFNVINFVTVATRYQYSWDELCFIFKVSKEYAKKVAKEQGLDVARINSIGATNFKNVIAAVKVTDIGRINREQLANEINIVYCIDLIKNEGYDLARTAKEMGIELEKLTICLSHSRIYAEFCQTFPSAPKVASAYVEEMNSGLIKNGKVVVTKLVN